MAFISVFDVLGPNMIGPSSSHTAGAEIIVAGSSSVFDKRLGVEEGVKALRRSMGQA